MLAMPNARRPGSYRARRIGCGGCFFFAATTDWQLRGMVRTGAVCAGANDADGSGWPLQRARAWCVSHDTFPRREQPKRRRKAQRRNEKSHDRGRRFGCGGGGLTRLARCWRVSWQRAGFFGSLERVAWAITEAARGPESAEPLGADRSPDRRDAGGG